MKIDKNKLQELVHLARLKIKPEEEDSLIADLSEILEWVEHLKSIDTEGVEPLIHLTEEENVLRQDLAEKDYSQEHTLKNAPERFDNYFKVPQVLKSNK